MITHHLIVDKSFHFHLHFHRFLLWVPSLCRIVDQFVKQALLVVDLDALTLEATDEALRLHVSLLDLLVVSDLVGILVVFERFCHIEQYSVCALSLAFDLDVDAHQRCIIDTLPSNALWRVGTLTMRAELSDLSSCM